MPRFSRSLILVFVAANLPGVCQRPAATPKRAPAAQPAAPAPVANPVLPGDFPDPSVAKIGDTYWASATSSNWGPVFPLLTSKNLTDWQLVGHVFPNKLPDWADYYFWAPEISQENGKTYVYYSAHQKGGNLSVGVASADRPEGPYRDHGPLVGQPDGSIDAFPMRDEKGQLYLVWKEDGNSVKQPTPIWAQPLNEARTALTGQKTELFRNTAPWEGNLVEGVSMVRRGGYFYAFYAANGCCGHSCTYATGVARAKNLLGPWEKYDRNPVLTQTAQWKCPGHGTVVERDGRSFLLHHAYAAQGFENIGRQGMLSEFRWNAAGWPEFVGSNVPAAPPVANAAARLNATDEFTGSTLGLNWQWFLTQPAPQFALQSGRLRLTGQTTPGGAALGHQVYAAAYTATATLANPAQLLAGTTAGLAALGDPANELRLTAGDGRLRLVQLKESQAQTLAETALPAGATAALTLRVQVADGNQYRFAFSPDAGRTWQPLPADGSAVNGAYLPPWDRGVRVGVVTQGAGTAEFERFELVNQK